MSTLKGNSVHVDTEHLHVTLEDGRIISTPIKWYPELQKASLKELARYRFICRGTGIEWPKLDYQLSIESMLVGKSKNEAA